MDVVKKASETKIMKGVRAFVESSFFPIVLGAIVLYFYFCDAPVQALCTCAGCFAFILLFCRDTRPAISIAFLIVFTLRYKDNPEAYLTKGALTAYWILGPIVLATLVYRIVFRSVEWKQRSGLIGMALLSSAFLLSGIFSDYYSLDNFLYGVSSALCLFGVYAFFAFTMEKREDNLLYLARVCAVALCMIALQIFELYDRVYEKGTILDGAWKGNVVLGWGISNMIGEMLAFLLPAVFYLIYKEKLGPLYWVVALVGMLAIYLTLSRNALLWGGIAFGICSIANCIVGKNRVWNAVIALTIVVAVLGGFLMLDYIEQEGWLVTFFSEAGWDDHGRFEIYQEHLDLFAQSPLVGIGFYGYRGLQFFSVRYAHNTLVQMLASTGGIGFACYLFHRAQTMYVTFKEPKPDRLFMSGCIFVGIGFSLLSPTFFLSYFMVCYSIILLTLEKSCK